MIFNVGWVPQLNGNALAPCQLIAASIEDGETPQHRNPSEANWSTKGIKSELLAAPDMARGALQETVIAIWRLQKEQEQGDEDEVWKDHLEAWLVREWSSPFAILTDTTVNFRLGIGRSLKLPEFSPSK